ncbi:MAG: CinA family protein [bacterium]
MKLDEMVKKIIADKNITIAVAESCTGGLLGSFITSISGSSKIFKGGIISYSNDIKINILKVDEQIISSFGAVSRECAEAMANNVREIFDVDYSISITGIAGPDGGSEEKPVGTVWLACSDKFGVEAVLCNFSGDREQIRHSAVEKAIHILYSKIFKM